MRIIVRQSYTYTKRKLRAINDPKLFIDGAKLLIRMFEINQKIIFQPLFLRPVIESGHKLRAANSGASTVYVRISQKDNIRKGVDTRS